MNINRLRIALELIKSSYGAYMTVFGIILASSEYDVYHMNKIKHELVKKYNQHGTLYINIKNIFMCPVGRCNIYSINQETNSREFIASELKFIVPPIVKLWDDELIVNKKTDKN